ncbi:14199_t:CDS:2, partial [Racocetra persica]
DVISTDMQNQCSIVAQESTLAAADHDFSKLSLTPSVVFLISIPNDISGSFYNGQIKYLGDIHKKAEGSNKLESELKECITGIQEILKNQTVQLRLKNNKFKYYSPVSQEEITEVFELMSRIDPTLKIEETTQPIRLPQLEFDNLSFFSDPIPSKVYNNNNLKLENTDHYASFQHVYRTKTTKEHRPTYIQLQAKSESIPKYILVVKKFCDYISCKNCRKRRYVYSNKFLTDDEQNDYQQSLELYSYLCGVPIFSDNYYLKEVIFVHLQINCDSPIKILYYSSHKVENYPIFTIVEIAII